MTVISHDYNACQPKRPDAKTYYRYSAFIAISRCPAGSEGKPPSKTREKRTATSKLIPSPEVNTVTAPRRMTYSRAHPRSRGEHAPLFHRPFCIVGSSPLARGTRRERHRDRVPGGLIPARAGNTRPSSQARFQTRAHPRSRGEHPQELHERQKFGGSSPLTRGTHVGLLALAIILRLIPAYAAKHNTPVGCDPIAWGSSPLARGTLLPGFRALTPVGLIPARAGNTCTSLRRRPLLGAHPRSRGEHTPGDYSSGVIGGSSPLARGTLCGV